MMYEKQISYKQIGYFYHLFEKYEQVTRHIQFESSEQINNNLVWDVKLSLDVNQKVSMRKASQAISIMKNFLESLQ